MNTTQRSANKRFCTYFSIAVVGVLSFYGASFANVNVTVQNGPDTSFTTFSSTGCHLKQTASGSSSYFDCSQDATDGFGESSNTVSIGEDDVGIVVFADTIEDTCRQYNLWFGNMKTQSDGEFVLISASPFEAGDPLVITDNNGGKLKDGGIYTVAQHNIPKAIIAKDKHLTATTYKALSANGRPYYGIKVKSSTGDEVSYPFGDYSITPQCTVSTTNQMPIGSSSSTSSVQPSISSTNSSSGSGYINFAKLPNTEKKKVLKDVVKGVEELQFKKSANAFQLVKGTRVMGNISFHLYERTQ